MKKISGIYKITNLINGKVYIGQSVNIYCRWQKHKSQLIRNKHDNYYLQRAYNKHGKESFKFEIIEQCCPLLLNKRETYWYNHYKPNVYNLGNTGGVGTTSEETKRKISESSKGRKMPEEERKKHSLPMIGHEVSEETRKRLSITHLGKPTWNKGKHGVYSEETLEKMRNYRLGKSSWNKNICGEKSHMFGLKKISKDNQVKFIKIEEINDYINNGWILSKKASIIFNRK